MAKYNSIILLRVIIGFLVIASGCVNSNEPTQKTTPTSIKIINLDPSQLIITDVDTIKVLGDGWNSYGTMRSTGKSLSGAESKGVNWAYGKNDTAESHLNIQINVYDQTLSEQYLTGGGGLKGNDIAIGDMGRIYSDKNYVEVHFIKNNVLIVINGNNIGLEKTIELAKKQDEKISRILEMIQ